MNRTVGILLENIWKVLISLRLAVFVIASLAISLAVATTIESLHDSATAQYYVYRATWFYLLLTTLGLNILAVALSRLPWKRKHFPFLMAHAGILMILIGSYLTATLGLDGSMRLSEGEVSSAVELGDYVLLFKQNETVKSIPFPWMPVSVAETFKPTEYPEFKLKVERVLPDAEPKVSFVESTELKSKSAAAIQIKILGSPMGGAPEVWLWSGDAGWATQKMGPARFIIRDESQKDLGLGLPELSQTPEARIDFIVTKKGDLKYETVSIRGEKKSGTIDLSNIGNPDAPVMINPEWKMPIRVQVKKFVASAVNKTEYFPVKIKPQGMGSSLPQPAILVSLIQNPTSKLWLGLGDRADFTDKDGSAISVGYFPKRVVLPYALRLKTFEMKHDPGTMDPAAYSSFVQVVDQFQKNEAQLNELPVQHITMNEPMKVKEYTFYQASYIPDFPRPTTTVLSVNYDPGRALKYWGSILLILGAISLYVSKLIPKKKSVQESSK